jgi:Na+/melibiose symporter-like transporter
MFILGCLILSFSVLPLIFLSDLISTLIVFGIGGIGLGGTTVLSVVLVSDVIDELTVNMRKRQEGIYLGIRVFIIRLAFIVQALLFAIIHTSTGYIAGVPGVVIQPPEALFGIRTLISIIPLIVMFLSTLVFWKVYDITPEKAATLKEQLKKLNL